MMTPERSREDCRWKPLGNHHTLIQEDQTVGQVALQLGEQLGLDMPSHGEGISGQGNGRNSEGARSWCWGPSKG